MRLPSFCTAAIVSLLLAAAAATPASAATGFFEAGEYPATISGEQSGAQTLTLEGEVAVKCSHVTFGGSAEEPSETMALTPTYSECTAGGASATIKANGCTYVFKSGEEISEGKYKGSKEISCPTGQSIVVVAEPKEVCEAKIGTQSGLSSVTYKDETGASPPNLKVEESLSSIHYTVSKDGEGCPFSGTGEKTNGSDSAVSVMKASTGSGSVEFQDAKKATKLCKEAKVTCPNGMEYPADTKFSGTSVNGRFIYTKSGTEVSCTSGTFSGETTAKEGILLPTKLTALSFSPCTLSTGGGCSAFAGGTESNIFSIGNGKDGEMKLGTTQVTIQCPGVQGRSDCVYSGIVRIKIRGDTGMKATSEVDQTLAFLKGDKGENCPNDMTWKASWPMSTPTDLFVTF